MQTSGIIYLYQPPASHPQRASQRPSSWMRMSGMLLIALSLGGMVGPFIPTIRLESGYYISQAHHAFAAQKDPVNSLPPSAPVVFNPLLTPDGGSIDPVNREFSLIIPKIGVNAGVIPAVNPASPGEYLEALQKGVAHASTSFFPDEDGTVYLFSHSTNYDWFVKDLNAVFYLLKNLQTNDTIAIYYKGKQYLYRLTDKRIVKPTEISYLVPQSGKKRLILQTCWPPGSTTERLLLFADLISEQPSQR